MYPSTVTKSSRETDPSRQKTHEKRELTQDELDEQARQLAETNKGLYGNLLDIESDNITDAIGVDGLNEDRDVGSITEVGIARDVQAVVSGASEELDPHMNGVYLDKTVAERTMAAQLEEGVGEASGRLSDESRKDVEHATIAATTIDQVVKGNLEIIDGISPDMVRNIGTWTRGLLDVYGSAEKIPNEELTPLGEYIVAAHQTRGDELSPEDDTALDNAVADEQDLSGGETETPPTDTDAKEAATAEDDEPHTESRESGLVDAGIQRDEALKQLAREAFDLAV